MNTSERYPALAKLAILVAGENAVELPKQEVLAELGKVIESNEDYAKAVEAWLAKLSAADFQAIVSVDETALNRLIETAPKDAEFFLTDVFNIGIDPAKLNNAARSLSH